MRSNKCPAISENFTAILAIIVEAILAFVAIYYLANILGIHGMEPFSTFLDNLKNFLFALIGIVAAIMILLLLWMSVKWIKSDEKILTVAPFVVGTCVENYNGQAIADLLVAEVEEIRRVLKRAKHNPGNTSTSNHSYQYLLPSPRPLSESLQASLINLGTLNVGPFAIPIGQLLIILRRFNGRPEQTITGSIQKYGTVISLIAHYNGQYGSKTWESRDAIDVDIVNLVRDLAIRVAEDTFDEPATLLYDLGLDHLEKRNYQEAEKLFNRAITHKPDADSFFSLGVVFRMSAKTETLWITLTKL